MAKRRVRDEAVAAREAKRARWERAQRAAGIWRNPDGSVGGPVVNGERKGLGVVLPAAEVDAADLSASVGVLRAERCAARGAIRAMVEGHGVSFVLDAVCVAVEEMARLPGANPATVLDAAGLRSALFTWKMGRA